MKQILQKYSDVILMMGINLTEGQNVLIRSEPVHWDFINLLAQKAYGMGARYVHVDAVHPRVTKARIESSAEAFLDYYPEMLSKQLEIMVDERWAIVYLDGLEDPEVLNDVDQQRYGTVERARRQACVPFYNAIMNGTCPWTIAALPTPKWAAKIMRTTPDEDAVRELWKLLKPVLFLDRDDPVDAWERQSRILKKRAQTLIELELSALHFSGPGTDLNIALTPKSIWIGGSAQTVDGRAYFPNIPTYEVFTTPDYRKTEGTVRVTRPLTVLGAEVKQAWFRFRDGKVVEYGAQSGERALASFFDIDKRNRYLGETALVDVESPIYKSEKLFHSILFDENAACHIALGRGISNGIKDGEQMSDQELLEAGCNTALQHIDFMIGSNEVSVTGTARSGAEIAIIENGRFVI